MEDSISRFTCFKSTGLRSDVTSSIERSDKNTLLCITYKHVSVSAVQGVQQGA